MILSKPYITKMDDKIRINVDIESNNKIKTIWYECDQTFEEYICTERLDGFIVTLMLYAMKNGEDIICQEKISEKLYYQITNFLIPTLTKNIKEYKNIKIEAQLSNEKLNSKGLVGTGITCGVDSFYTIFHNKNKQTTNYNVNALTCFNTGGNGSYGGEKARKLFNERAKINESFAKQYNYLFLKVDSNISEFLNMVNIETHSYRTMAVPLIFQKLFRVYYFASGYSLNEFKIEKAGLAKIDLLNVHCFSNENVTFYSTGSECNRIEKLKLVSEFEETYNYLNVCTDTSKNCSKCEKCIRTMLELYSIDKLELYKNVFDIDLFYKKFNKYCSNIILYKNNIFYKEIKQELKKNNKRIPFLAYILGILRIIKKGVFRS